MEYVNTKNSISEDEIFNGIIDGTLTELIDTDLTKLFPYRFYRHPGIKNIILPNINTITYTSGVSCLSQIPNLESVEIGVSDSGGYIDMFRDCNNLVKAKLNGRINSNYVILGNAFINCDKLQAVLIESDKPIRFNMSDPYNSYGMSGSRVGAACVPIYVSDSLYSQYKTSLYPKYPIFKLSDYPTNDFGSITDSWDDILEAENDGTYLSKYSIGDTKTQLVDGRYAICEIVGFDLDDLSDGSGKAHISWMTKNNIYFNPISDGSSYETSWARNAFIKNSLINYYIMNNTDSNFLNALKTVKRSMFSTDLGTKFEDSKITIPSMRELNMGHRFSDDQFESSGPIYVDAFPDNEHRRKLYAPSGQSSYYWTRTATRMGRYRFMGYDGDTSTAKVDYSARYGVVICFCT